MAKEIYLDSDDLHSFLYIELIKRGYAPGVDELDDVVDAVFDFFEMKGVIEE